MKKVLIVVSALALPLVSFAAFSGISSWVESFGNIVRMLIPIVFALALLVFFWGLVKYIWNAGDEEKKKEGRGLMIWGIVALFVMSSVWGLTSFIGEQLNITTTDKNEAVPDISGFKSF